MNKNFIITKSFFQFLVTIKDEKVTIATIEPCKYEKSVLDIFAEIQRLTIEGYLIRQKVKEDLYIGVHQYFYNRQWLITEIHQQDLKEKNLLEGA